MKPEQLKTFFAERPALSKEAVARESGISPRLLVAILSGDRTLTDRSAEKLIPVLEKYGYTALSGVQPVQSDVCRKDRKRPPPAGEPGQLLEPAGV